jgi:hypothetical protein
MAITPRVKEEKRGVPVVVGDLTIVPVEQVSIRQIRLAGQILIIGSKRPVAVIIQSGDREWRLDLPGQDDSPEEP